MPKSCHDIIYYIMIRCIFTGSNLGAQDTPLGAQFIGNFSLGVFTCFQRLYGVIKYAEFPCEKLIRREATEIEER